MKTAKAKKRATKKVNTTPKPKRPALKKSPSYDRYFEKADHIECDIDLIDFSPYNKRKFFKQSELEELAENIKIYGVIQDIGVRPKKEGRYELVFGERRLRAAKMAGLQTLQVKCAVIPDDVVKEIMLSENVHRENQHPMDEAFSIALMMEDKKTNDEIALRLGKSKSFVSGRIKLLSLIEPLQELYYYDKLKMKDALLLATLCNDSQKEVFEKNCQGWKDQPEFELDSVDFLIRNYQFNLRTAPFDINDKKLVAKAGACGSCDFNSATQTSLFPQEEDIALCRNKGCFEMKCLMHFSRKIKTVADELQPAALVVASSLSKSVLDAAASVEAVKDLPRYERYAISEVIFPIMPHPKEFESKEPNSEEIYFDEAGFNQAMEEYKQDENEFNRLLADGTVIKGLGLSNTTCVPFYFSLDNARAVVKKANVTAKQVQEAIRTGQETAELLNEELKRLQGKEKRAIELESVHIQEETHAQFKSHISTLSNHKMFTEADAIATRLIVYQSLSSDYRTTIHEAIGLGSNPKDSELFEALKRINPLQFAIMVRAAIAGKSDSKLTGSVTGICLLHLAEAAGVDVAKIEADENALAVSRTKAFNERVESLQIRIEELNNKAA